MFKKFVISYDHRVDIKFIKSIKDYLTENNMEFIVSVDDDSESNDYPILAKMAHEVFVKEKADCMILLCGTGVGMNVVANKFDGIRSVLPDSEAMAYFARRDEDANSIVFAAGKSDEFYAMKICRRKMIRMLDVFIKTEFEGGRHNRRLEQITNIEKNGV